MRQGGREKEIGVEKEQPFYCVKKLKLILLYCYKMSHEMKEPLL